MLVKSTTRHVRLYSAEVKGNELIPSDRVLTLDIDPDNEFNWNEDALQKVYRKFDELVESSTGAPSEITISILRCSGRAISLSHAQSIASPSIFSLSIPSFNISPNCFDDFLQFVSADL